MELLKNVWSLNPCSFYMNIARHFKAFEYKEEFGVTLPQEEFLEELWSFLHIHQLGDVIDVSELPVGDQLTKCYFYVQDDVLGYKKFESATHRQREEAM